MRYLHRSGAALTAVLLVTACGQDLTSPPADSPEATPIDPSIITPFILPRNADWGLYFQSFNQTQTLTARVIHYRNGRVSGQGIFNLPTVGNGLLTLTSASPYGDCIPHASPCGSVTNVPESAVATGTATFLTGLHAGQTVPITLDLHSNLWPNPTNTFDTATLTFCYAAAQCDSYSFYGELHHEPQ
jgi:hypothetical protein